MTTSGKDDNPHPIKIMIGITVGGVRAAQKLIKIGVEIEICGVSRLDTVDLKPAINIFQTLF